MQLVGRSFVAAANLLANPEILKVAFLTLKVSGTAVFVSMLLGIPTGIWLALDQFRGRGIIVTLINTGMGLPPVAAGLLIYLLFSRASGPLGFLGLLYTPAAMVIAQVLIAFPIVSGLTLVAIQQLDPKLRLQILSLGASRTQMLWALLKEARLPALAAVMAGFGGVISEVGAVMMVGGNIKGQTRVLTTAIVEEVGKGHLEAAVALSVILLVLTFAVNLILTILQQRSASPWLKRIWK